MTDQAEADFRAAVAAFEELGERWGLAMAVSGLAQVEEWRGELRRGGRPLRAGGRARRGTRHDGGRGAVPAAPRARALAPGGADRDRSRAELARALRDADRLGWPEVTAYADYVAGNLARLEGDLAAARERLDLAARAPEGHGLGLGQIAAVTCTARGYLAAAEGDLAAASSWQRTGARGGAADRGLPGDRRGADRNGRPGGARGGTPVRAATLLGAAEGLRGTQDRSDEDGARVTAAARALLGPADYGAAFQRGQAVSLATLEAALDGFLTRGA